MPFFDHVQTCSFAGVLIPVDMIEVVGGLRDHIHEPPHADGGIPEKLGRKLYVIHVHGIFDEGISGYVPGGKYDDNYPDSMWKLRTVMESGLTDDLVLPNLGTIKAYARNWPQKWSAERRSGEDANYEFVEDPQVSLAVGVFNLDTVPDTQAMFVQLDHFNVLAQSSADRLTAAKQSRVPGTALDLSQVSNVDTTLFSSIANVFNEVITLRDQEGLLATLLEEKVAALTQYADRLTQAVTSPFDIRMLYALQDMMASARSFQSNAQNSIAPIKTWTVTKTMPATDISTAIFGDTTHVMDILNMNPIENAYRVRAGTKIRYIDSSAAVGNLSLGSAATFMRAA